MNIIVECSTKTLYVDQQRLMIAIGRSGGGVKNHEGDGVTPFGTYPLRAVYFRADKVAIPLTDLPEFMITPDMGWCDDPQSNEYNKLIQLPTQYSHEKMWRDDDVYDLVVVVGYNDDPVVPGNGSAIFMHLARGDMEPTEGCIALKKLDFLWLIGLLKKGSTITIK